MPDAGDYEAAATVSAVLGVGSLLAFLFRSAGPAPPSGSGNKAAACLVVGNACGAKATIPANTGISLKVTVVGAEPRKVAVTGGGLTLADGTWAGISDFQVIPLDSAPLKAGAYPLVVTLTYPDGTTIVIRGLTLTVNASLAPTPATVGPNAPTGSGGASGKVSGCLSCLS